MSTESPSPSLMIAATAQAVKQLREEAGLSQEAAAKKIDLTKSGWQLWEAGQRRVILSSDIQERIAAALGVTVERILLERAKILGVAPPRPGRALHSVSEGEPASFEIPTWARAQPTPDGGQRFDSEEPSRRLDLRRRYGPGVRAMVLVDNTLDPWGHAGLTVVYDPDRFPRPGQGCVVRTTDGNYFVKLYVSSDMNNLALEELSPARREITMPMQRVDGIWPVIDRLEA